ncbi:MAG: ROK family protein [Bacteroidetes bacterium]|jgi:glucokinase|nr:ROK family protein [Bacteroidota bacterium]
MTEKRRAIGIDLGATNIKGILVDNNGNILKKKERETNDQTESSQESGEVWKEAIYEMVQKFMEESEKKISAIGLAAPGLPDLQNANISYMPGRLQGLEQFNWSQLLSEYRLPVKVLNDAQAALMAESQFGSAKGAENIVMLTLGTGVGGGIMINGELYQGNIQRAGHLGHISVHSDGAQDITGVPGSLEDAFGDATVEKRSLGRFETTRQLVDAHKDGDYFASYIWLKSLRDLSVGISSLINAFSPDLVILGGGITLAEHHLFDPLNHFLNLYEWRPGGRKTPVKKAESGLFAGAIGAAAFSLLNM